MALGSPVGSPVGSPMSMGPSAQFLPQYLLGESDMNQSLLQSHSGPSAARQLAMSPTSPGSGRHVMSPPSMGGLGPALSSVDSRMNRYALSFAFVDKWPFAKVGRIINFLLCFTVCSRAAGASGLLGQSEKGSGPPTTGLFDTLRPSSEQSQFLSPTKPIDNSMYQS